MPQLLSSNLHCTYTPRFCHLLSKFPTHPWTLKTTEPSSESDTNYHCQWLGYITIYASAICSKAGRTLRRRRTKGKAEQGTETQHRKHCVTQCERILRRRRKKGRETQHEKHCVTESVSAHWDVVSCNLAKWAMAEFIALKFRVRFRWRNGHADVILSHIKRAEFGMEKRVYKKEKNSRWIRFDVWILC